MKFLKKPIVIASIAVLLLGGTVAAYAIWGRNDKKAPEEKSGATQEETKVKTEESPTQQHVQVTTEESIKTPPASSGGNLVEPSGSFVSNHKVSLSSANYMNSICRTTAGATCEIRFTKGSEVKVLGPNQVGVSGYVSWDWKLQDIGLTQGTWQIEAVAKSGGNEKSAKDNISLEIQP